MVPWTSTLARRRPPAWRRTGFTPHRGRTGIRGFASTARRRRSSTRAGNCRTSRGQLTVVYGPGSHPRRHVAATSCGARADPQSARMVASATRWPARPIIQASRPPPTAGTLREVGMINANPIGRGRPADGRPSGALTTISQLELGRAARVHHRRSDIDLYPVLCVRKDLVAAGIIIQTNKFEFQFVQ